MQQQQTVSLLDCEVRQKVDFIQQLLMTSSVAGLRRSPRALPKAKLAPKKKKNGHGHCFVACCPSDPLQLSESWQNHYIWEVCSAIWRDASKTAMPTPALVNRKGPVPHLTMPRGCTNWAAKFCLICCIHLTSRQLITTSPSISTTFFRENASITSRTQKMLSKNPSNPESQIFMLQE